LPFILQSYSLQNLHHLAKPLVTLHVANVVYTHMSGHFSLQTKWIIRWTSMCAQWDIFPSPFILHGCPRQVLQYCSYVLLGTYLSCRTICNQARLFSSSINWQKGT
jgi:hypothetical protein